VRGLLARLEPSIEEVDDPAATAMLAIVERIVGQWHDDLVAIERAWDAHESAMADEARTRKALATVLRSLVELVGLARRDRPSSARPDSAAGRPPVRPERDAATEHGGEPTLPNEARDAGLAACLLGPFRLLRRGRPLEEWHGSKTSRVLRFLVAQRGRFVPRDALIEQFWPDADAESARRSVHQMIYTIRKSLRGPAPPDDESTSPLIVFENDAYALDVHDGFWCDASEFEDHVAAGRRAESERRHDDAVTHYARAQALYRGDFLEDLPYDEWVQADRRHLRMLYVETVNRLAEARLAAGAVDEALELSQRLLSCDPCDESAHRRVMRCYASSGNRGLLTQQYEACANAMEQVLGLTPDPETVELYSSLVNRN
jgi:DNA-binding SARP family transcriptional activator